MLVLHLTRRLIGYRRGIGPAANGKRLPIYTNSGQADLKEACAYEMDVNKNPIPGW